MLRPGRFILMLLLICVLARPALAGMLAPPTLREVSRLRLQSLSFFLVVLLLSALFIKLLWNGLRKDFTRLPRLSYPKALGVIALWGLLFVLVLAMISGARELLTPAAHHRRGHQPGGAYLSGE